MKKSKLKKLGISEGKQMNIAIQCVSEALNRGMKQREVQKIVKDIIRSPEEYKEDQLFAPLAYEIALRDIPKPKPAQFEGRAEPAPYQQWGEDLDAESIRQMERACQLPVSVRGALMPDAHVGYGLPIGGVLAVDNAVIPYAVGVDIACRMKLTVLDLPIKYLDKKEDRLIQALEEETRFGIGSTFKNRRTHEVMDEDWKVSGITFAHKDKAWAQLGTSGSGNHFVEYGILEIFGDDFNLPPGTYLALLSHSGSRGTGALVAGHYSRLARDLHPELPKELQHLAWLDLDTESGQEYWAAMQLMGKYAAANHALIHKHIATHLGAEVLLDVENHHNFAWKEVHDGKEVIVHRKGATPAHQGVLGIIPGSMASPAYVARGKGNPASLESAAHGAGRVMSRKQANKTFKWSDVKKHLKEQKVKLLSAGLDEVPMVYKNIDEVMAAQKDLVDVLAKFQPRIVKMAPAGERPED